MKAMPIVRLPRARGIAISFLLLLGAGCSTEDSRDPCEQDLDCPAGTTCEENRCTPATPVTLTAESPLPPAPVGLEYSAELPVSGGVPPLSYSLLQRPSGLSWLRIDGATGALSGTPALSSEAPFAFQVSVADRSRQQATKSYELTVTRCAEGTTVSCFAPLAGDTCGRGTALCTDGVPGPCTPTTPSTEVGHCGVSGEGCGACGDTGNLCEEGSCGCGDGPSCADAEACCGGGSGAGCVDVQNDPDNCGGCGVRCEAGVNAIPECRFGSCVTATSCAPGFGACDPAQPGSCTTNTSLDFNNCGSCSNACDADKANLCEGGLCACGDSGGTCAESESCCEEGDGLPLGCTRTDEGVRTGAGILRCGGCSAPLCTDPGGAGHATCEGGVCGAECENGASGNWRDCNGSLEVNPPQQCDVNLNDDVNNCGACGNVCEGPISGNGTASCENGVCGANCLATYNECPLVEGVECRSQTSSQSCGLTCSVPVGINKTSPQVINNTSQSSAACAAPQLDATGSLVHACTVDTPSSSCVYAVTCNTSWGNCDGNDLTNGCETNLLTSGSHCGACGNNCSANPTPHATSMACETGTCAATGCEANWARCDSRLQCDTPTNVSDVNNCGSCNSCPPPPSGNGSAVCNVSTCGLACNSGYQACGGDCISISSPEHCGSCGAVCETWDDGAGGSQQCTGGRCCTTTCIEGQPCRTFCE